MSDLIEVAAKKIAAATRPISFSGAGLSAESGISTFRDNSEDALWANFDPTRLASQEGFKADPAAVIDWYSARRRKLAQAVPNAAHKALGQQAGWTHITQNVDHLLEQGGANAKHVLHLHGSLLKDQCNADCGHTEVIDLNDPPGLRDCPECGNRMRPSVVWFGESLRQHVLNRATAEAAEADLLLVIGTSAVVYPAAGLIPLASEAGADIIFVNTEASEMADGKSIEIIGKAGDVLPLLFK